MGYKSRAGSIGAGLGSGRLVTCLPDAPCVSMVQPYAKP